MDIPAMSIALSQGNLAQSVGLSVFKMAKDQDVQRGQDMVQMMQQSVQPNLGSKLNILV